MKIRGIVISGICLLAACVTLLHWNTAGATVRLSDAEMGAVRGKYVTGCPCTSDQLRPCLDIPPSECITCFEQEGYCPTQGCPAYTTEYSQNRIHMCLGTSGKTCYVGLVPQDCYRTRWCTTLNPISDAGCFLQETGEKLCDYHESKQGYECKQCWDGSAGDWTQYKGQLCI